MPNTIITGIDSVRLGLTSAFSTFMNFLPVILGALIVLAVGWLVSGWIAKLVSRFLHASRIEHVVKQSGLHSYFKFSRPDQPMVSDTIALLTKWFIRLVFIQAAANILGMPQVTAIINNILLFIPNLIVAVLILVVGSFAARWLGNLVEASVARMGVSRPVIFGLITRYGIIGFSAIACLNQLGIATVLVNSLFIGSF